MAGSRSGSAPVQSVTQKLQFEAMMTFLHLLTRILMENTSTFNVTAVAVIIGAKKKDMNCWFFSLIGKYRAQRNSKWISNSSNKAVISPFKEPRLRFDQAWNSIKQESLYLIGHKDEENKLLFFCLTFEMKVII